VTGTAYMARKSATQAGRRLSARSRSDDHKGHAVGLAGPATESMDGQEARSRAELSSGGFSASNRVRREYLV